MDSRRQALASVLNSAVYNSESRTLSPKPSAVGFRTHGNRFANLREGRVSRVAEEFLVASRNRRWDREAQRSIAHYFSTPMTLALSLADHEPEAGVAAIGLPEEALEPSMPLHDVVSKRRSTRAYTGVPLPLTGLTTLLRYSGAVTGHGDAQIASGEEARLSFRTVPSAGGLYPIEVWLAVLRVTDLERGLYRYLPADDALASAGRPEALERLLGAIDMGGGTVQLDRAGAVLLFIAQPWRSMRKYGARGMRHVFHETGAMAQAMHLAAAALGIGTTDFSSFYDDETHEALGLDGVHRAVTHMVVAGSPAEEQGL